MNGDGLEGGNMTPEIDWQARAVSAEVALEAAKAALAAEAWRIAQCSPTMDGPIHYRITSSDQNAVAHSVLAALKLLGAA